MGRVGNRWVVRELVVRHALSRSVSWRQSFDALNELRLIRADVGLPLTSVPRIRERYVQAVGVENFYFEIDAVRVPLDQHGPPIGRD